MDSVSCAGPAWIRVMGRVMDSIENMAKQPNLASRADLGEVAQLVEHTTENRGVAGSIPALAIDEGPANRRLVRGHRAVGAEAGRAFSAAISFSSPFP